MTQHNLQLLQLGILLVFIGVIIIFISLITAAATSSKDKEKSNVKFSVVGFLGFIPFGFGNDKKFLLFGVILTVVVVAATVILFSRRIS